MALEYRDLLLYQISGGNMGKKPEIDIPDDIATFSEKKALLSEMIKLADIEQKNHEDEEPESGLDLIKKGLRDADRENSRGGNPWGTAESGSDDTDGAEEALKDS